MISKALVTLTKLQFYGKLRRLLRTLKTPRKAIFLGAGLIWLGLMIVPNLLHQDKKFLPIETVQMVIPLGLCVAFFMGFLTSASEKTLVFTMSEVDFLFAGPFTRSELLGYKLFKTFWGILISTLFISIFTIRYTPNWFCSVVGIFLSLFFLHLTGMTVVLLKELIAERAYTRFRKIVLGVFIGLAAIGALHVVQMGANEGFVPFLKQFRSTIPGIVLSAPFNVFARVITADILFPDFVIWTVVAAVINLGLLFLVLRLDADYIETAATASQKFYERLQKAKRGETELKFGKRSAKGWVLPSFPWLGGIGPVCWQQVIYVSRISRRILVFLPVVVIAVVPFSTSMGHSSGTGSDLGFCGNGVLRHTFNLSMMVPFGFRVYIDRIDCLKVLPLSRLPPLLLGFLVPPVLFLTFLHVILFGGMTAVRCRRTFCFYGSADILLLYRLTYLLLVLII